MEKDFLGLLDSPTSLSPERYSEPSFQGRNVSFKVFASSTVFPKTLTYLLTARLWVFPENATLPIRSFLQQTESARPGTAGGDHKRSAVEYPSETARQIRKSSRKQTWTLAPSEKQRRDDSQLPLPAGVQLQGLLTAADQKSNSAVATSSRAKKLQLPLLLRKNFQRNSRANLRR